MAKFRLNRRTVLRGAGSIAIALPWLEIMEPERKAHAAAAPAARFLGVYTPGGAVRRQRCRGVNKWRPTGTETAPILSPILAPLKPIMDAKKLLIVDGLDYKCKDGEQHQAGIIAWMTGTGQLSRAPERRLAGHQLLRVGALDRSGHCHPDLGEQEEVSELSRWPSAGARARRTVCSRRSAARTSRTTSRPAPSRPGSIRFRSSPTFSEA